MLGLDLERCAFDDFEQSLLDAFAADIFAMTDLRGADFVDLVEADDATLCSGNIVICGCQQPLNTDFGVFANVAGLGEWGAVGHAEWDSEDTGEGFGHERFPYAGRAQ